MQKLISSFLTDKELGDVMTALTSSLVAVKPFSISLQDADRKGLRIMAEGREGIARTVCRLSLEHEDQLPRNEDPHLLEQALAYHDRLLALQERAAHFFEMVDDTLVGLKVDIMKLSDQYSTYLQAARTSNANLDAGMNQIDEYNKRFGNRTADKTDETPPAN